MIWRYKMPCHGLIRDSSGCKSGIVCSWSVGCSSLVFFYWSRKAPTLHQLAVPLPIAFIIQNSDVLITGCFSGIDQGLVLEFQKRGSRVWVFARNLQNIRAMVSQSIKRLALDVAFELQVCEIVKHVLIARRPFGLIGEQCWLWQHRDIDWYVGWRAEVTVLHQCVCTHGLLRLLVPHMCVCVFVDQDITVNIGTVSGVFLPRFWALLCL